MSGAEVPIALAVAKGAAGAAGRLAVEQVVRTFKTEPLKWEIGVIGAVRVAIPDVPESDVSDALSAITHSLQPGRGLHAPNPTAYVADAGGFEIDVVSDTFGSMDELEEDELATLFDYSADGDHVNGTGTESDLVEEVEPTISSVTTYFYPRSLPRVSDIEKLFGVMQRVESGVSRGILNKGTFRWLLVVTEASRVGDLRRAVYNWSRRGGATTEDFSDEAGHLGIQIKNPTDLQVHQLVRILRSNLGGLPARLLRRG